MLALVLALVLPQQPSVPAFALQPLPLADVHLDGWLGARVDSNRDRWLRAVDLDERLQPFVHRPAQQPWAGEHLGKWLHAASIACAYSGDTALRARLDTAAAALIGSQESDGYLGAYLPDQRFQLLPGADWDVWTIKYALLGLLEYHRQFGDAASLQACTRGADLLIATFGDGKRSILSAGTHRGMAATSVLEPIARLHRLTGERRFLDFARRIVAAWDEPGGPRVAAALREHGRVAATANGKAYEMLSNLLGLCELYRATGDADLLRPVQAAFANIVADELLPTGSMSSHEHFCGGGRLPAGPQSNLGETCVSVTWLQLCDELLQITGDARFGREIERTAYNHLTAAQRPDGAQFCYYTALRGTKPYSTAMTCCSSSGARGLALLPQCAVFGDDHGLVVNLLEPAHGTATLGGRRVAFALQSGVPRTGAVSLRFDGELPATFAVRVRLSDWAVPAILSIGDKERTIEEPGFVTVAERAWSRDDVIDLAVRCRGQRIVDANDGDRAAAQWGPCVLALPTGAVEHGDTDRWELTMFRPRLLPGPALAVEIDVSHGLPSQRAAFVPFADVGADGSAYRVWLGLPAWRVVDAIGGVRSRPGNVQGSIQDGDRDSFVVTFDGRPAAEDWYAIAFAAPVTFRRVEFAHGHSFHDGGWFDASVQKPEVQIRARPGADWQTIGRLDDYPATTDRDAAGLRDGQLFALELAEATTAVEVRVVGTPASGDAPPQAFSSCAELRCLREP